MGATTLKLSSSIGVIRQANKAEELGLPDCWRST